jgi:hypothetical protein
MIYQAVQENYYDLRLSAWKWWLLLLFSTTQINYARYGTYYVDIKILNDLLQTTDLSIQAQDDNRD